MKKILNRLINQESISSEEAKNVLVNISEGQYNQSQIASFLTVYMMRSITIEELRGFRDALLELCIPVDLEGYNSDDDGGGVGPPPLGIYRIVNYASGETLQVPDASVADMANISEFGYQGLNHQNFDSLLSCYHCPAVKVFICEAGRLMWSPTDRGAGAKAGYRSISGAMSSPATAAGQPLSDAA